MNVLVAKNGPLEGGVFPIAGRTLIGRGGECDIQVIDQGVSRKHACVLELDDGTVLLRDLASDNGTWVRGEPVLEAKLSPGDEIGVGGTSFEFCVDARPSVEIPELDLKLMSGPARSPTIETRLTAEQRARLIAAMQVQRHAHSAAAAPPPAARQCCDSPLAAHAREHKWKFCPACGGALDA
jgi:pSer/pThr/pTyr-binding forkhead associated (FHA) protein